MLFSEIAISVMHPSVSHFRYAPIGIMFLIAGKIMSIDDLVGTASKLGLFMVTVITGLVIHSALILPSLYLIVTRKNPFVFFRGILHAWVTALATASRYVGILIYN